jgi:hypothetical protein
MKFDGGSEGVQLVSRFYSDEAHIYISVFFYKQGAPTERFILFLIPPSRPQTFGSCTYHTTRKTVFAWFYLYKGDGGIRALQLIYDFAPSGAFCL